MNRPVTNKQKVANDLYRAVVLRHAKQPLRFGKLAGATHRAKGINPLCGDKLEIELDVRGEQIFDFAFQGTGCTISIASASMLGNLVHHTRVAEASRLARDVQAMLDDESSAALDDEDLLALTSVRAYPARVKCATLAWQTLLAAIAAADAPVSTE